MYSYSDKLIRAIDDENNEEVQKLREKFLDELKICVNQDDVEGFNRLVDILIDYGIKDINSVNGIYNSEIRQFIYDLIIGERAKFFESWTDKQYGEIVNSIILEKMGKFFSKENTILNMLTDQDRSELLESFLISFLEFSPFTLQGIIADDWYFRSIKHRVETYVFYSLSSLELMLDTLSRIKFESRDYLPNRKYTDEMFAYADELYNDMTKRLKQEEVIVDTLKKFEISIDKLDSFKVRWGIYRRHLNDKKK